MAKKKALQKAPRRHGLIAALRPHTRLYFDVHLMIEQPERYIDAFVKAGADSITIHYESTQEHAAILTDLKKRY